METMKLLNECTLTQYNNNTYRSPWLFKIRNILNTCGLTNIFDSGLSDFSVKWLTAQAKRRLQDQLIQSWHVEINQKEVCTLYRSFKTDCAFEKYIAE